MADFRRIAELTKLARLLNTQPDALDGLQALSSAQLRDLRLTSVQVLLNERRALFSRLASASKLLPNALIATIAERSLGPLLCARVAGEMATPRAIEIARHLKPEFLAHAVVHLETERACELTAAMPVATVEAAAQVLIAEREFIVLGDLVGNLPVHITNAILPKITDGEAILRSAFFLENTDRISSMMEALPESMLQMLIKTAADERLDLWSHALALISSVPEVWQRKLVGMATSGDEGTLTSMVLGVIKHDLWEVALPLLTLMSDDGVRRLVNLPALADDTVMRKLLHSAQAYDLWHHLLPLALSMEEPMRERTGHLIDELDDDTLRHIVTVTFQHNLWSPALWLVLHMNAERQLRIATLMADAPDEALNGLLQSLQASDQWYQVLSLFARLDEPVRRRIMHLPLFGSLEAQRDIIMAADRHALWHVVLPLLSLMEENMRRSVAEAAECLDTEALRRWSGSVREPSLWPAALDFVRLMKPALRDTLAREFADQDDGLVKSMLSTMNDNGQWQPLLGLLAELPTTTQQLWMQRVLKLTN